MGTTSIGQGPPPATGDAAADDNFARKNITLDAESLARLIRLCAVFGRSASEVIRFALELQETGNNRLARHGVREPLQALRSSIDAVRPQLRVDDADILAVMDRAVMAIDTRLNTAPAAAADPR